MIDREIFSSRLIALRTAKGLTTSAIARELGLKQQSVFTWEKTKTLPSADKLQELADLLDVSLDYLTGRSDTKERLP